MRLRWKIGLIGACVVGTLAAGVAVLPRVVDVEAYKPALIEAVREATGRELVIDGPMRLAIFPVPGIGAGKVHFSNAVGAVGAQMIDVAWVSVTPSWRALLQGRIEVGRLTLYRPAIVLETDADGRPNWDFAPGAGARQAAGAASAGLHLAVGRVSIVNGTVTYTNPRTNTTIAARDVHGGATVGSFDGPFEIDGKADVNGVPLEIELAVGPRSEKGHTARLSLKVASGRLGFEGTVGTISPDGEVQGHLSVHTGLPQDFIVSIANAIGAKPGVDLTGLGNFSFEGDLQRTSNRLAATKFDAKAGADEASGSLALTFADRPALEGKVSLTRLDVEKWLEILSRPGDLLPSAGEKSAPGGGKEAVSASPWSAVDASLTLAIEQTLYRRGTVHELSVTFDLKEGVLALSQVKAVLPGDMSVAADTAAGTFSLSATRLRDTLRWLGIDTGGVPAGKLAALALDGKLAAGEGALKLSDARLSLDGMPGTVGGTLTFGPPLALAADVRLEQFDLDAYMPPVSSAAAKGGPASAAGAPLQSAGTSPSVALKLAVASLVYRGQMLKGIQGDATVQGARLDLANLEVADLLGARIGLKGSVDDFGTVPKYDLAFTADMPDTDRLLDYAGLPHFLNGKIGRASASGSVSGQRATFALRDVAANFLGVAGRLSGTLTFGEPDAFDFPSVALQSQDMSALVSAASGKTMTGVGALSANGSLKGSSKRATFTGELDARGTRMNGTLDATLGARPNVTAVLKVPGTLALDEFLGIAGSSPSAPAAPAGGVPLAPVHAATATPIDTQALRSFDAKLSLSTSAVSLAALKVDYADLEATLVNGVLKIGTLTGQFYGGAVAFTGTIDATGEELAIDLSGDLRGIYLGQLLRGTLGDNRLGSSDFKVVLEGEVDATGIRLTGRGRSALEIRNGLTASGTFGGYLYPLADAGSTGWAKFASGIGSLFSEAMAFNAMVLQSFVNFKNTLSGQWSLSAGTLAMDNPSVHGQSATAYITGSTNVTNETTDTTVRVGSVDNQFIATIKGPLSSPTIVTGRPPGN